MIDLKKITLDAIEKLLIVLKSIIGKRSTKEIKDYHASKNIILEKVVEQVQLTA